MTFITVLCGDIGSGKTLAAVALIKDLLDEDPSLGLWSNTPLRFPNRECVFMAPPVINKKKPRIPWKEAQHAAMLFDEFHVWFDARRSSSTANVFISYFITQVRKHDVQLFITTQDFDQVDLRLQRLTNMRIDCRPIFIPRGSKPHDEKPRSYCRNCDHFVDMHIYHRPNLWGGTPSGRLALEQESYWDYFDSWQEVDPIGFQPTPEEAPEPLAVDWSQVPRGEERGRQVA